MCTPSQIKKIHTLKTISGTDDDLYRDMLASFGVCSSKQLTVAEADVLIDILQDKANAVKNNVYKKYDEFLNRDEKMATPAQLRKMEVLWVNMSDAEDKHKAMFEFLYDHFHVWGLRFLTKKRASQIIAVFEKMQIQKCLKAI